MRIYFPLYLLVVLCSCKTKDKIALEKVWFYEDTQTQEEQLENLRKYGGNGEYGFSAASFLNLQPDGSFTSYLSAFDYGNWKLHDSTLVLTTHNKGRMSLELKSLTPGQMICKNTSTHKVFRFNGFKNSFPSDSENPFAITNNLWRVRPNHKESDLELSSRLKNHFRWWEKYFSWGLNSNIKVLDIRSTPSVLELYGNGFELKYYDYQFPEWRNIFYDTANCWRAYEMVYYSMYKKSINWPKTENRFESFVSAFKQLQQWMEIDPATYLPARQAIPQTHGRKGSGMPYQNKKD